jgi:tetratricopeptide (TPR) repeat protein
MALRRPRATKPKKGFGKHLRNNQTEGSDFFMNRLVIAVLLMLATSLGLMAQKKVSKGEYEAYMTMAQAPDPDSRIKAAENLVTKYADSSFKGYAFYVMAVSYEQKGDNAKAMAYGDQAVQADPKLYKAMLMMAKSIAQRTREFDLDKDEKLARAEKYANDAIALAKDAPKPNPQIPDAQWDAAKKDDVADGHMALGLVAVARKKYDVAVTELKTSIDGAGTPEPAVVLTLARVYNVMGKYDDAMSTADTVMKMPDVPANFKSLAQAERARAFQNKQAAAAKPAEAKPAETKQP